MDAIDTANKFIVTARVTDAAHYIAIRNPPMAWITSEEALNLAAWLVALSGDRERFEAVFRAVAAT